MELLTHRPINWLKFIDVIARYIRENGGELVREEEKKYFLYKRGDFYYKIPFMQRYTRSVHIYNEENTYGFHSLLKDPEKVLEAFKKHTRPLW